MQQGIKFKKSRCRQLFRIRFVSFAYFIVICSLVYWYPYIFKSCKHVGLNSEPYLWLFTATESFEFCVSCGTSYIL